MSRFGRDVVDQNSLIRYFDANVAALVVLLQWFSKLVSPTHQISARAAGLPGHCAQTLPQQKCFIFLSCHFPLAASASF
jgi:hypothetical protein